MSSELVAVLDKNDNVISAQRFGSRWRFQRKMKARPGNLSEEREQEILAAYVDNPGLESQEICELYEIKKNVLYRLLETFGIPTRFNTQPKSRRGSTPSPQARESATTSATTPTPGPAWRVTVIREVTEKHVGTLADIEAQCKAAGLKIVRVEAL